MHVYNRMLHLFSALLISFGVSAQSDLVITGVMDGPLSGGTPKVLELYVMSDVADASTYSVYRYSNGGTSAYSVYTFPAIALTAGQHYTIASDSAKYYAFFGSNADGFGSLYINGDDIVELRMGSDTVDVFGQYGVDGTGQCWDHLDGWAYRNNGVSPTASFDCNEWTFSGTNALDGQTTNAGAPTPFPSATYTGTSAPSFTTYTVTNVGAVFTPESLAIELGDSVHWSISGNHNVNGSQGTYPNNPESFYSGPAPITSFGHRFTISGAYDYQCDPHVGIGQTGYIEVQGPLNPVSNLAMASNGEDEVNVSWTQPAGAHGVDWDGVAVFMSESPFSSFFTNNAQELSNYTGNFSYTGGTSVSADGTNTGYCIYNSTNNSGGNIDIDGLNAGTTYYVVAYAYRTVAASDDDVSTEEAASVTTDSPVINSDLIITGIMDGPLSGGTPKALEIYAMNDVADISSYTVQFAGNGGATYNVAAQLPAIGLNAGDFYYVTTDSAQFYAYLGFSADQKGGAYPNGLYVNGDDHVALFKGSYPVDYYGVYQVDGTGECWDHLDGWAYRNNNSSPTTAFDCAEWTFSGTNALDGTSTNATAPNPWPVGTYGTVAVVDLEVTEIMSSSAHSNANSDGDWFEIRNNGSTSVNLNGYSWDNSSQTAGTHTFGNYVLAAGQSLIVLDEDSSSIQKWSNDWGQTANSIRVIARDMIGLTGFDDLSKAGDGVYLYDANGALIESAVFTVGNTGNSVEFSNGTPTQSVAGVNGAYTSTDGDVGSPGDMTPVYVTVPTYSISQVRSVDANGVADSLNTYCKLSGTVTSIDFDGNSGYSFYMTDGTQGINVYRSSDLSNYTSPAMGDNIEVTGTIAQFRGLLEIIPDSLTLVSQNNTVPAPMIVTTLDESTESELITFENVTLVDTADWPTSATSRNVDFVTSGGDTLTMRIDFDAAIFGNTPLGSFDLTGIGAQYDASSPYLEGYQIFPRSNADIYTGPVIPSYTIAQVRGVDSLGVPDSTGTYCKLTGTVTSIDFDGNSGYNFYISDGTRGIYVYRSSDLSNYTSPAMGDMIRVTGYIGAYRGLTQIVPDSLALISQNNALPTPMLVTTLDESTEGELITLEDVTLVDPADWPSSRTSRNIDFYTAAGDTLTMRIDYDANIYGNTPTASFDIIGLGGQYDASSPYFDGYQIFPRSSADIVQSTPAPGIPTYAIAQVRGVDSLGVPDSTGTYCKLNGTVTSIDFDGNSGYSFSISDGTRGIYVYRSSDLSNYTSPMMGDQLRVVGSIGAYRGLSQIAVDSITLISQNNNLPSPILVNTLDESTEGELILLENVTLVDTADWPSQRTTRNIDIYTTNGDTLTMRIDYDADIYGNTPAGSFDLVGVGGQYDASSPYFDGYQILPRGWSDITMNNPGTGGTAFQQYCYQVDSIYTIGQAKKGRFRATFGQLATGEKYRFRWVQADANYNIDSTQIRSKEFNNPNKGYMNFSVAPWFNSKVLVWLEVDTLDGQGEVWANPLACTADRNGATVLPIPLGGGGGVILGSVIDGDMEEVSVPCKPQTLTLVEQAAATCPTDSALLRAGYAGGTGGPSYLWSTGDTTKRIYVAQGATVSVTVTDEVGCSVSDSITASILAYAAEAPSGVSVSNSGPSVRIVSWSASSMGAGQTLIGYRVQYRVRGTSSWTNAPLTANTTDTIDFTGAGPAGTSENYEFSVVARFTDTDGTNKTSARACFVSKGVTYKGGNGSSALMPGGSMAITVYPNPAKDVVYVNAPIGSTVELMDISGRIMATQISEGVETSFGLSDMADGVYMIQIKSNGEVTTERLIKQ